MTQAVEVVAPGSRTFDASYLGSDPVSADSIEAVSESAVNIGEMRRRMAVRCKFSSDFSFSNCSGGARGQEAQGPQPRWRSCDHYCESGPRPHR